MIYDVIIIGAGAAGLFAGASFPCGVKGLILEKQKTPGKKLLMSGAGQCNVTHGGNIKEFISHYGTNGPSIRSILYQFNNQSLTRFFESNGLPLFQRDDGKVFPQSLNANDVLKLLVNQSKSNGFQLNLCSPVDQIQKEPDSNFFHVHSNGIAYQTKNIIVATGGCSYPTTGSDGSFYAVLKKAGIEHTNLKPALVPIYVANYPFTSISGIALPMTEITIQTGQKVVKSIKDALLFTHGSFSGPAILTASRYVTHNNTLSINYCSAYPNDQLFQELPQLLSSSKKQFITVIWDYFNHTTSAGTGELPKRFLSLQAQRCFIDSTEKASKIPASAVKKYISSLTQDHFIIEKTGGFQAAMVTSGGIPLTAIQGKTMESSQYSGLYFAGEVLDVDGDTGGYNLQFAFSSAYAAAKQISLTLKK